MSGPAAFLEQRCPSLQHCIVLDYEVSLGVAGPTLRGKGLRASHTGPTCCCGPAHSAQL